MKPKGIAHGGEIKNIQAAQLGRPGYPGPIKQLCTAPLALSFGNLTPAGGICMLLHTLPKY
jgi:hypothetical protein